MNLLSVGLIGLWVVIGAGEICKNMPDGPFCYAEKYILICKSGVDAHQIDCANGCKMGAKTCIYEEHSNGWIYWIIVLACSIAILLITMLVYKFREQLTCRCYQREMVAIV